MDPADFARLRNLIACELNAQLGMRNEHLELEHVPAAAYAVAARLDRAFRIEWSPLWQDDDSDEELGSPDAATFHGSELPGAEPYPIFDHPWPRRV